MAAVLIILVIFSLLSLLGIFILFIRPVDRQRQLEKNQERLERTVKEEIFQNRHETREVLKTFQDSILCRMKESENSQKNQVDTLLKQLASLIIMNEQKLEKVRGVVEERLKLLQEENTQKLEQMRVIVDEKLQTTLDKRLSDSFKKVNEHLESVHRGLGEMQSLASNVGDLKKVLTNVKTRGTWGEIQLGMLLEQLLTPDQYEVNVEVKKNTNERVEFAIKLPGRDDEETVVWLPIDAKFPQEDYQRLLQAQEETDIKGIEESIQQLQGRIKAGAKDIKEKYIDPPNTTDFAIMYLPTEGLFAQVLGISGFFDMLQREFRVIVTGPTTLAAVLNSLQMGFRTLAIQKRSSQVWQLLAKVKQEFVKFGDILDKTQKKLTEASSTIELATKKSRTIERRLSKVDQAPEQDDLKISNGTVGEALEERASPAKDVFFSK
ncbi:MAG: DNA recombination protein RmuC [Candidatus Omnitrophota bacterium]|nr:MAG: DNA recombination protein RmuC [Candidatus Omnitrophota bacterium]